ncbi:hypothetical protein V8G54_011694 [Vigna mungo]|uniref:Uncharacterized protein n=1 Tax=Vigna mungo TaxID=3915 RepID=A0AAQ3NRP5_VIGMU
MKAWSKAFYVHPGNHSWFIWFRRGISLKFPKWLIKWFSKFGPLPSIFPSQVAEVSSYFREKTSFESGYRLISFVATQSITWIVAWEYIIESAYENVDIKSLSRRFKLKWWNKFNSSLISKKKHLSMASQL